MKRNVFRKIFILYFAVLLISIVFVELYITNVIRNNYITNLNESLSVQALMIADLVPFRSERKLDALCGQLKEKTGARITVINDKGEVLGDSDRDSSQMENHADRAEIQEALLSGMGTSLRGSDTTDSDLLYVARKIESGGTMRGFIRLAVPLDKINSSVNQLKIKINLVVILILLASGAVIIWQTDRIRKFVTQIKDYTGALTHGLFRRRLYLEDAGEFTELAHNLNTMASELKANIDKKDEEKNRLSVIIKSIPDALILINKSGIIELSNNAARELFAEQRIEERSYIEVVRSPVFSSLVEEVMKDRRPGSAELVLDVPEEKYLFVRVSPLSYRVGELAGVVAIFHDTTQRKKLEQMRKDFVANVSHEMKTPITAIKGFTETLLDGAMFDRENAEEFLHTINTHSKRLNRLVEDLLMLSKIELGVIIMDKTDVNVSDVLDSVNRTFLVQAAEKNITVKKSVPSEEATVHADRHRLEQMLLNLVDNAVKFTESGGEIETGASSENGRPYLYVKDTGIGVPKKFLPRLGERFFRVDPSRSRELGGTGLGLAIVKHLAKAHGWDMKIESEEGKGTTVRIYY